PRGSRTSGASSSARARAAARSAVTATRISAPKRRACLTAWKPSSRTTSSLPACRRQRPRVSGEEEEEEEAAEGDAAEPTVGWGAGAGRPGAGPSGAGPSGSGTVMSGSLRALRVVSGAVRRGTARRARYGSLGVRGAEPCAGRAAGRRLRVRPLARQGEQLGRLRVSPEGGGRGGHGARGGRVPGRGGTGVPARRGGRGRGRGGRCRDRPGGRGPGPGAGPRSAP